MLPSRAGTKRIRHDATVADLPARRTLADIVRSLDGLDPAAGSGVARTIFAERPWGPESLAVVLREEPLRGRAPSLPSYASLLDVDDAAAVLEVWSSRRSGRAPSPEEAAEALIHFAAHDTHQPTTCEHHGCGRPGAGSCSACRRSICSRHADGSMGDVECPSCSSRSAPSRGRRSTPPRNALWIGLLLAGVLSLALGTVVRSVPLSVGGACLLIVGACTWLSRLVLRIMG